MNRATWALLAASLLFGGAILAFVLTSGRSKTTERVETTIVEAPPLTPLRDSGPKNNTATQTTHRARSSRGVTATGPPSTAAPQNRPVPTTKRQKPKRTHKPSSARQPSAPPQPSSPQPAPRPPVDVQAPAPVTVCVRPAGGVNCP